VATERPKDITIRGRLSWPKFTMPEAIAFNNSSRFPKPADKVRPSFQLLLDDVQQDKLITYLKDEFLPWTIEQDKAGEKSGLTAAQVKKLTKVLDAAEWDVDAVLGLIKPVHEKTADLAPESVSSLSVNGMPGRDIVRKAVVRSEDQLANPTDDVIVPARGLILPVEDTTLELYPGSYCAAQLNLFAFTAAGNPGITASTGTIIFVGEADRFGGGGSVVDEDDLFMSIGD